MPQPKFNPDKVWERSVTWKNHSSWIRSDNKEYDSANAFEERHRGTVSVPGFVVEVHAARFVKNGQKTYCFTNLSTVKDGKYITVKFKKFYSKQYCVTLAKRFAKRLSEGNDV